MSFVRLKWTIDRCLRVYWLLSIQNLLSISVMIGRSILHHRHWTWHPVTTDSLSSEMKQITNLYMVRRILLIHLSAPVLKWNARRRRGKPNNLRKSPQMIGKKWYPRRHWIFSAFYLSFGIFWFISSGLPSVAGPLQGSVPYFDTFSEL